MAVTAKSALIIGLIFLWSTGWAAEPLSVSKSVCRQQYETRIDQCSAEPTDSESCTRAAVSQRRLCEAAQAKAPTSPTPTVNAHPEEIDLANFDPNL